MREHFGVVARRTSPKSRKSYAYARVGLSSFAPFKDGGHELQAVKKIARLTTAPIGTFHEPLAVDLPGKPGTFSLDLRGTSDYRQLPFLRNGACQAVITTTIPYGFVHGEQDRISRAEFTPPLRPVGRTFLTPTGAGDTGSDRRPEAIGLSFEQRVTPGNAISAGYSRGGVRWWSDRSGTGKSTLVSPHRGFRPDQVADR